MPCAALAKPEPVLLGIGNRQGTHFATRYAGDFAAATVLRDEVADQIEQGSLPSEQPAAAA